MLISKEISILFLISSLSNLEAQILHHQMISSQGASVQLENGMKITQTIGQLSINGNLNADYLKGTQGFQQAIINAYNSVGSDRKSVV